MTDRDGIRIGLIPTEAMVVVDILAEHDNLSAN